MAAKCEASVSVMELPSKRLLSIDLPSEEGGDIITMAEFMSLVRDKLSGGLALSHLIMDRRIKHNDYDRPLHFFLLDGSPCFAYTVARRRTVIPEEQDVPIFIKGLSGRIFTILVPLSASILDVKILIQDIDGTPLDEQRLIFSGMQLENGHSLSDYKVKLESTLHLVLCLRGGASVPGVRFTDVTDGKGPEEMQWSDEAPDWRIAYPGLCIEGECANRTCEAYGHMVIMNKGWTEFDLINDSHLCKCPICKERVVPITCGFNNCKWKIIARKVELGKPPQMFKTDWKSVGDLYEYYSPEKSGEANFVALKIICRETDGQKLICFECGSEGTKENMQQAGCGHLFHAAGCFDVVDRDCIECVANRNMTNYQKLFR